MTWCSCSEMQILVPLFCMGTTHLSHSDCFVVILKFYTVLMFLQAVSNFVNQKAFSSKHIFNNFYHKNMKLFLNYVTATLRALFCVMRLTCTGCPKSKVTILIFNNFLMKEVAWIKFVWYLVMILNFCLKLINLCKFSY